MAAALALTDSIVIPEEEVSVSAVRSSGPGGQNVNKVSTKVRLKWDVGSSKALPEPWRQRVLVRYKKRISSEGMLVLTSQRFRDQSRNREDCFAKLRELLLAVRHPPTPRKKTRPSKGAQRRRLEQKKQRSQQKASRRYRPDLCRRNGHAGGSRVPR